MNVFKSKRLFCLNATVLVFSLLFGLPQVALGKASGPIFQDPAKEETNKPRTGYAKDESSENYRTKTPTSFVLDTWRYVIGTFVAGAGIAYAVWWKLGQVAQQAAEATRLAQEAADASKQQAAEAKKASDRLTNETRATFDELRSFFVRQANCVDGASGRDPCVVSGQVKRRGGSATIKRVTEFLEETSEEADDESEREHTDSGLSTEDPPAKKIKRKPSNIRISLFSPNTTESRIKALQREIKDCKK